MQNQQSGTYGGEQLVKHSTVRKEKNEIVRLIAFKAERVLQNKLFRLYGAPLFFFSCYVLFILFYINPAVIYSSNGMNINKYVSIMHTPETTAFTDLLFRPRYILELTPEYLRDVVIAPGGWARFAVTLGIYACHYPIAGAMTITALAFLFYWLFPLFIQGIGVRRPSFLRFVPAFFILTICAWYEMSYFAFLVPVAGSLALAVFYQRLQTTRVLNATLWTSALFWIAWYLLQWGGALLLLWIIIHEFFNGKRTVIPVVISAAGNAILFFCIETWFIPLKMAIRWSDFMILSGLPFIVIGFFPLTAIILAVFNRLWREPEGGMKTISPIIRVSLLVCGTAAAVTWLYSEPVNRDTRIIARTAYHVKNGRWEKILCENTSPFFADFPEKSGPLQIFMVHTVNHALCQSGQMGDKLFAFPQAMFSYDPLLMLQSMSVQAYVNWFVVLDLAMDLGMVNTAEKIAAELMENMGPYPDIIYRRALVQIAKGNVDAASVYLKKLTVMPFYRGEAKRLLSMIGDNVAHISESRIATMRANMDTVDYFLDNNLSFEAICEYLLQSNPNNKIAYDYLMSYYLLYLKLDRLAVYASNAPRFGYTVLPRYWEEGLFFFQSVNPQRTSNHSFPALQPEASERFNDFTDVWGKIKDDPDVASKLADSFGDSYYYYSLFKYTAGAIND